MVRKISTDTIAAIATPPGKGGIGIVRISGPKSKTISKLILKKELKPKMANFGVFYDENDNVIDQGFAIYFKKPNSFTGEDILELHGHGNPIILDQILKRILQLGARLAHPGEFSERAFLNKKIDLAQAEAVADLIEAQSEQAARSAIKSLQGEFSKQINKLVESLIKTRVQIEASIDFPEEEIDFKSNEKISNDLKEIIKKLENINLSAKQGSLLRDGMTIVIAGKPNAGKSSLLNCLSGKDVAIVTEIAGTTRDVLREYIHIDGMPLHIIDTAGLQESKNIIEQEGIRRAWQEIGKADEVLLMVDCTLTNETDPQKLLPDFFEKTKSQKKITIIMNKIDLIGKKPCIEKQNNNAVIYMSAKTHEGLELLKNHLKEAMGFKETTEGIFIARRRHLDALTKARTFLFSAQKKLKENQMAELIAEDLRLVQKALAEITGEFTSEDLLDEIFSSFCIGK